MSAREMTAAEEWHKGLHLTDGVDDEPEPDGDGVIA